MLCFSYIAFPLLVMVRTICLLDNFKIINVTWILERYIGRVGEGLMLTRTSSYLFQVYRLQKEQKKIRVAPGINTTFGVARRIVGGHKSWVRQRQIWCSVSEGV